jgi:hypothetical protein
MNMPSSNKTLYLALNKWLGMDKPKKDDFNHDNQIIDEAVHAVSARVESLDGAVNATLAAHTNNAAVHTTQSDKTSWNNTAANFSSHRSDSAAHVTAKEKELWSQGAELVVGHYTGNGSNTQKITLGFEPQFGLVFAVGDGIGRVNWIGSQFYMNCACMSRHGCSTGLTLHNDGFTAGYAISGMDGFAQRLNANGVQYVYFIWK